MTVTGSGFGSGTLAGVDFGGRPARHVAVVSPTELIAKAPAAVQPPNTNGQAGGPANVTVSVRSGQGLSTSRPNAASVFDYVATSGHSDLPSVRGLGPYGGPVSGGNRVVVYGSGFVAGGPVSSVTFGGRAATGVIVRGNSELTAIVPPRTAATSCETRPGFDPAADCQVQVVVTGLHGASAATTIRPGYTGPAVPNGAGYLAPRPGTEVTPAPTEYDYVPRPTIRSISPNPAGSTGSRSVTITGSGFDILTFDWVDFGAPGVYDDQDSALLSIGPNQIVLDPPGASPSREPVMLAGGISVTTLGGISAPAARVRRHSVGELHPPAGWTRHGGERVTLRGRGLGDATSLRFVGDGATSSYDVVARSDTSVTFVAPAALPNVDVLRAYTASGCSSVTRVADTFVVFNAGSPSVSGLSPARWPGARRDVGDGLRRQSRRRNPGSLRNR